MGIERRLYRRGFAQELDDDPGATLLAAAVAGRVANGKRAGAAEGPPGAKVRLLPVLRLEGRGVFGGGVRPGNGTILGVARNLGEFHAT